MYCMRHGAQSCFIDLRPLAADGHGRLGLDLCPGQGRSHTVSDAAVPPDPLCARACRARPDLSKAADTPRAAGRCRHRRRPRGGYLTQTAGLTITSPGNAGLITGLFVVLTPLITRLFGTRIRWWTWIAVVVSLAGLVLLTGGPTGMNTG